MSPEAEHIRDLAWQLGYAERWKLGQQLLCDAPPEVIAGVPHHPAYDDDWEPSEEELAEIRRRCQELDDGTVTPIPWETVRARLQQRIDAARSRNADSE